MPVTPRAPEQQTLDRRLRDLREVAALLARSGMTPLQVCKAIIEERLLDQKARRFFSELPEGERHYWISSLYALLMPKGRRRRLAAYFTPPHLARHAIDLLIEHGVRPGTDCILDPASGGAAFLVPLAAQIADQHRQRGSGAQSTLLAIESTLAGIEIEHDLAVLSHVLLADLLRTEIAKAGRRPNIAIRTADTLKLDTTLGTYDAIVGNPPYGRVFRPAKSLVRRFAPVITDGYVNLYSLFVEQALRLVRPSGLVCLIVPMSLIGGPSFASLRKRILQCAHILRLDPVDKRSDVFLDVLYDVCVLVLRKRDDRYRANPASSHLILIGHPPRFLGHLDLPTNPTDRIWGVPDGILDDQLFQDSLETIHDYGYVAKNGYFVWNREQHRYRSGFTPRPTEVPLFWAHNVRPNLVCTPSEGRSDPLRIGLVKISKDSPGKICTDAIILQRTSNRRQKRRLTAGIIRGREVPGRRGFVTENHTILLLPDPTMTQKISLTMLCCLLNTASVDARFRRMSGSVSVSTRALRHLPLPQAETVLACFARDVAHDDAAEAAYKLSVRQMPAPVTRTARRRTSRDGE